MGTNFANFSIKCVPCKLFSCLVNSRLVHSKLKNANKITNYSNFDKYQNKSNSQLSDESFFENFSPKVQLV